MGSLKLTRTIRSALSVKGCQKTGLGRMWAADSHERMLFNQSAWALSTLRYCVVFVCVFLERGKACATARVPLFSMNSIISGKPSPPLLVAVVLTFLLDFFVVLTLRISVWCGMESQHGMYGVAQAGLLCN